ncbi:MAG TPA: efflux RND transporter periplasmic adaptor subunit [Balneolales bacterium]|nr:efflux RND transporter periplasmic adaptor subunit [Balneolales bacterium]
MKYQTIITVIVFAILGTGAYYFLDANQSPDIIWRTLKSERGNININVNTTGTLQAVDTVDVGTQVSGTIAKLFVDYNSKVKKGQLVALIDTTTLATQVDNAKATLRSSEAKLDLAMENYKRTQRLYNKQLIADSSYDHAKVNVAVAKSNVAVDKARLESAKLNLSHATIYAPISGVVINRNVSVGQTVAASYNTPTLFVIANNLSKMQVQASIDEENIGKVKVGQPVTFTVDAYPEDTFTGKVSQIRLNPTTTNNVVTYTVIINVENPDMKLMPGMTANISIKVKQSKNVVKVPAMALQFTAPKVYLQELSKKGSDFSENSHQQKKPEGRQGHMNQSHMNSNGDHPQNNSNAVRKILRPGDQATLWVKNGKNVKPEKVTIGLSNGSYTAVKGKIKAGDNIVIGAILPNKNQLANNPFSRRRRGRR